MKLSTLLTGKKLNQRGFSSFFLGKQRLKDIDKDNVPDIFDCSPFDSSRDAPIIPPSLQAKRPKVPPTIAQIKKAKMPSPGPPDKKQLTPEEQKAREEEWKRQQQKKYEEALKKWEEETKVEVPTKSGNITLNVREYNEYIQRLNSFAETGKQQGWKADNLRVRAAVSYAESKALKSAYLSNLSAVKFAKIKAQKTAPQIAYKDEFGNLYSMSPEAAKQAGYTAVKVDAKGQPISSPGYNAPSFLKPEYSSLAQKRLYEQLAKPLEQETQRYKDYGYSSSTAKMLAQESLKRGGVTFTPQYAKSLIKEKSVEKPKPNAVIPLNEPFKQYKLPVKDRLKRLIHEYNQNPQKFIRKYGKQTTDTVLRTINKLTTITEKELIEEQEFKAERPIVEFFGGRTNLLPYEKKGTAVITKVKYLSEEELKKRYPFGATKVIAKRLQSKLDFDSQQIINHYIKKFQNEFEIKTKKELDELNLELQNKIAKKILTPEQAIKEYDEQSKIIINKNSNEFSNKVKNASRDELNILTQDAQKYIEAVEKDLRVSKAIALAPSRIATGFGLTFGLGLLPSTMGSAVGLGIGAMTLTQTPEIIKYTQESPLASGIEMSSFLVGGAAGGEMLRIKEGKPTITGKTVQKSLEITKKIPEASSRIVEKSLEITKKISEASSKNFQRMLKDTRGEARFPQFQKLKKKKKKKPKTPFEELTEHLLDLKELNEQSKIDEILNKVDKKFIKKIKNLPKEEKIKAIKDYQRWKNFLREQGVILDTFEIVPTGEKADSQISKQILFQKTTPKIKSTPLIFESAANKQVMKELEGIKQKERVKIASTFLQKQSQKQKQTPQQTSSLLVSSSLKSVQPTKQKILPKISSVESNFFGRFAKPKLGKPKKLLSPEIYLHFHFPEEVKYKQEQPYDAYVLVDATKKTRRYKKLNKEPLTHKSALSIMAKAVDTTISARGKIVKSKPIIQKGKKIMPKAKDLKDDYYQKTKYKFRSWKTKKKKPLPTGVIIERQKFRLDSPEEVKKIHKERKKAINVRNFFGF